MTRKLQTDEVWDALSHVLGLKDITERAGIRALSIHLERDEPVRISFEDNLAAGSALAVGKHSGPVTVLVEEDLYAVEDGGGAKS